VSLPGAPSGPVLTRFCGRESARAKLLQVIPEDRLVTLVGAPGCGKTRLGQELLASLAERFADGVGFVELAPVGDPSLVASVVATALGVDEVPGLSAEEALVGALATKTSVVVLDNCEHLLDTVAALVVRLLGGCPLLHVLATSRTALGLRGERVWRVPPLDLVPAVELFKDRSGLSGPGAGVAPPSNTVVRQICRGLDGLPLAIELAAAWTRVLTPAEILDRLQNALPLLRSHARDASPRQQTMEATVDWSRQLLDPAGQRLLEHLSVFAGGFNLEAAQAVWPGDDVFDGLASLVDHSLALAEPASGDAMRYRLLEPVRQCAESWLEARGEREAARRRHAEHYLAVALRLDAGLRSSEPGAVLARLEEEDGNFRVALAWARGQADDLGLRLATALATSWAIRGRVNEGRAWMEEMLDVRAATADRRLWASGLARTSRLAWRQRDYSAAGAFLDASLAIGYELGDLPGVARRLRSLAVVAVAEGDLAEAERLCERSASIFRSHGDQYGLTLALAFLGMTLHLASDQARADRYVKEALDLTRLNGNVTGALYSLGSMAFGAVAAGDMAALRMNVAEIVDLLRSLGGRHEDPGWLWWMAVALASGEGRYRSALRLAGAAGAVARRDGLDLHEPLRGQVEPWLERARMNVGAIKASELSAEGSRLSLDELMDEALRASDHEGPARLTSRESEIVEFVAAGLTNNEIAQHLVISTRTVESHVDHIKTKLGLARRAHIVAWALEGRHANDAGNGAAPKNDR
jgi:predicted ATPase/DNA-binding NarL/FixJ family response regulator